MTVTHTWNVYSTDRVLSSGVIEMVHYEVTATEGDTSVSEKFSTDLNAPDVTTMTDYDQVTAEQCLGWVKDRLGEDVVTDVQERVAAMLSVQQDPPTHGSGVPW